jgi:hypothetical protein
MTKWLNKKCNKNKCTCFFDKLFSKNWGECCSAHDTDYIYNPDNITKYEADDKLYECLKKHTWGWMAWIMWLAVAYSPIAKNYWKKYRSRDETD